MGENSATPRLNPPTQAHRLAKHIHGRIAAQRGFHPGRNLSTRLHRRDNDTAGGTLNQLVLGRLQPPLGRDSSLLVFAF